MSIKDHLKTVGKIAVSSSILIYLLSWIPIKRVVRIISDLGFSSILGLTTLLIAEILISTASIYILANYHTNISFTETFKLDSINFIANTFIPTRLGSMVSMPILFDRYTSATKGDGAVIQTTQLVLMTTVTGSAAGIGWILFHEILTYRLRLILGISTILYMGFPVMIVSGYLLSDQDIVQNHIIDRLPVPSLSRGARIDSQRLLLSMCCLTITKIVVAGSRMWVLAVEFNIEFGLLELLFIPALMYSVTVLPVSLGGIGIAEASGTMVLTALGIPVDAAAAFIIIDRVFAMYLPVIGFYIYLNLSGLPTKFETTNKKDEM